MPKQSYTIKEVAVLLSITEPMVQLLLDEGELFFQKNDGEYRIPVSQFEYVKTTK